MTYVLPRNIPGWLTRALLALAVSGCASNGVVPRADQNPIGPRESQPAESSDARKKSQDSVKTIAETSRPVVFERDGEATVRSSLKQPGPKLSLSERLKIPDELPGADAPPLSLLPSDVGHAEQRQTAIDALFPRLPLLTSDLPPLAVSDRPEWTLTDLEQVALNNNPKIAQAAADIEAATGSAAQAGVYPNPVVGYEADTVGSAGTRNYQGMFFTQDIITAGKLDLARAIANMDLMNQQLGLRAARADLLRVVRANYFSVLVAEENLRYSEALVRFTNEVYRVQVEQLKGEITAAYEPMQLRALAVQARGEFAKAGNRYKSAWKQLAAALGDPNLPVASLAGEGARAGAPIDYEAALDYMLSNHTDVLSARNLRFQGQLNVRLAEVTPIPDVKLYSAIQHDFTTPPVGRTTYNLQVGIPLPIFNQNRGGIRKARGELVRAEQELGRVRVDLSAQLADAFERYENNRILLQYYRDSILPDQVRVYRGIYERHQQQPDLVGFGDVIVAQQNLLASIGNFIAAMNGQWTAYADLAALLQLEDLNQLPLAPTIGAELPPEPALEPLPVPAAAPENGS
ncbi:MAG: TolC family protein [Planctomycetaceae bacterium]|nr:TolC family protein [Planctomycetaceae bacterium]